jgi:hypothetical protein
MSVDLCRHITDNDKADVDVKLSTTNALHGPKQRVWLQPAGGWGDGCKADDPYATSESKALTPASSIKE